MKEIITEWRKFLKESKTKQLKEIKSASVKDAGISIGEMLKEQITNAVENYKIEKLIEDFSALKLDY